MSARRLTRRSHRDADGAFLAEGLQAVREAVAAGLVRELFVTADARSRYGDMVAACADSGAAVHVVSDAIAASLSETVTPQGIVAVCPKPQPALEALVGARLVVVLDEVRDPGNLGTIIRTADAAGADAVVLTKGSVDPFNGKAVRASAGSLFHLPVVTDQAWPVLLAELRAAGLRVLATSGAGPEDLDALVDRGDLAAPTAWVFGNEAHGLPSEVLADCDAAVRVPIHGHAESLNLATAVAICLYSSARSHRPSAGEAG